MTNIVRMKPRLRLVDESNLQKMQIASVAQGHRSYLDPNPRLVSARTTAWRAPQMRGHRAFIEPRIAHPQPDNKHG